MILYIFLFVTALFGSNKNLNDNEVNSDKTISQNPLSIQAERPPLPEEIWGIIFKNSDSNAKNDLGLVCKDFQKIVDQYTYGIKFSSGKIVFLYDMPPLLERLPNVNSVQLNPSTTECWINIIVSYLPLLSKIEDLNLYGCKRLTDKDLLDLSVLMNLKNLNLENCENVIDNGVPHLSLLINLRHLSLSVCKNITDNSLQNMSSSKNLTNLNLQGCQKITHAGLQHLSGLTNITYLDLSWFRTLIDAGLQHLSGLTNIKYLNLECCYKITDDGIQHLSKLKNLTDLNLNYCHQITDDGIGKLKKKLPQTTISSD